MHVAKSVKERATWWLLTVDDQEVREEAARHGEVGMYVEVGSLRSM